MPVPEALSGFVRRSFCRVPPVIATVPEEVRTAFVSVRLITVGVITAASLVPVMLTVTVLVVPSALVTVMTSLYTVPATNSLCAVLVV